jgi:hypothetical protein
MCLVRGNSFPVALSRNLSMADALREVADYRDKQKSAGFRVRQHKATGTVNLERRGWIDIINPHGGKTEAEYWAEPTV